VQLSPTLLRVAKQLPGFALRGQPWLLEACKNYPYQRTVATMGRAVNKSMSTILIGAPPPVSDTRMVAMNPALGAPYGGVVLAVDPGTDPYKAMMVAYGANRGSDAFIN
jgi:hypothetical protein